MEKLNLRQKLVEIRKGVEYLQKDMQGNQGARYVDPAVLLRKIRSGMDEHGVILSPKIIDAEMSLILQPSKNNKEKNDHLCCMRMEMVWLDADSDETISVPWFATGSHMQDPSMAFGGALTYTERYFLLKYFNIPTAQDDPEQFDQKTADKLSNDEIGKLVDIVNGKGFPVDGTLNKMARKIFNVDNLNQVPSCKFEDACNFLNELPSKPNDTGK